jgi:hypothetical protein
MFRIHTVLILRSIAPICFLNPQNVMVAAEPPSLAIVNSGVQPSEDAPYASRDYRFLPGDYLYFTFQISGFAIRSEERGAVEKINLSYEVTAEDANGVALAPPNSGGIQTELSPEDKHWMPKRQLSFLIPSFVAAGEFRIHVHVKDMVANTESSQDFPFSIGGIQIQQSNSVTAENFRFLRNENDAQRLEVPAYSPGDSVHARFEIVGFKIDTQNHYHVAYGLVVLRPDGTPFVQEPNAAELQSSSFYPAQFLPGVIDLKTTRSALHGEYIIVLAIRDVLAGTTSQIRRGFSIE